MNGGSLARLANKQPEVDPDSIALVGTSLVWKGTAYDITISSSTVPGGVCERVLTIKVVVGESLATQGTADTETYQPPDGKDGGPSLRVTQGSRVDVRPAMQTLSPALKAVGKAVGRTLRSAPIEVTPGETVELEVTPPGSHEGGPSLRLSFVAR